jgi:hypothetical protein
MKRVSQRVRVMTPRLRKVESMSQIRMVRSLVECRLSLHTRRLATQTSLSLFSFSLSLSLSLLEFATAPTSQPPTLSCVQCDLI